MKKFKLNFNSTKDRAGSYVAMQTVADDVALFNKEVNRLLKLDLALPCPTGGKDFDGIANSSEIWFGDDSKPFNTIDINCKVKRVITFAPCSKRLDLLFKLTSLSLCEQFVYSSVITEDKDDWNEAVAMYETLVGSISDNAAKSLGLKKRD